jgi:glycerol-3-phosphate acyltransferase PlsY
MIPDPASAGVPDIGLPTTLALLAIGWLVGSFPSAIVVGRARGFDVTRDGDGNPGSANVWKLAGPAAGTTVFLLDIAKVVLPGLAGWVVAGWWGAWAGAIGAVLGAMRPAWPAWPGGRGVNAGAGAAIVLAPAAAALGVVAFAATYLVARSRVAAVSAGFVAYPIALVALTVREPDDMWPIAGIGVLYLLLVARYVATDRARRGRPGGAPPGP